MQNGDGKPSVLVVEDDCGLGSAISAWLEFEGFRPVVVETGQEALLRISDDNLSAALIDVHLPDINGLALSHLIRTQFGPSLPIVVMSGDTTERVKDRLLDAGADEFLPKPVNPEQLVDRLNKLLPKRRVAKPHVREVGESL